MNFSKIYLYGIFVALTMSCKSKTTVSESNPKKQPNILIIHVDDLGYHDLSVNGSKIYQTPNIDGLGKESVQFQNAYANYPRCVPSRYAMLTGEYPIFNGEVPDDGFEMNSIPFEKNYVKNIKAAGYQTAYFGKWHLGEGESSPKAFGFDTTVAAGKAGSPISYIYPFNQPKKGKGSAEKDPIKDLDEISKEGDYLTDVLTDQVLHYIQNRDKSKPFMAMLAFYAVHQPLEAKKEDTERNQKEIEAFDFGNQTEYIFEGTGRTKMRQDNAVYAAMVENMDENVGRILQLLKKLDIEDNTIIVLSSDHGGLSNDGTKQRDLATTNYPLRAGKGWLYEGGIKVPLFIKWKNHLQPIVNKKSLVMLMDVFPTLLDFTTNKKLNTSGKSFLPVINNKEDWQNRTVYWHSEKARPTQTGDTKSSAIREANYKLINWSEKGKTELYDINQDPYESNNILAKNPKMAKELLEKLNEWKSRF